MGQGAQLGVSAATCWERCQVDSKSEMANKLRLYYWIIHHKQQGTSVSHLMLVFCFLYDIPPYPIFLMMIKLHKYKCPLSHISLTYSTSTF